MIADVLEAHIRSIQRTAAGVTVKLAVYLVQDGGVDLLGHQQYVRALQQQNQSVLAPNASNADVVTYGNGVLAAVNAAGVITLPPVKGGGITGTVVDAGPTSYPMVCSL